MQVRLFIFLSLWVVSNLKASELLFEEAIDMALVASRQIKLSKIDTKLARINTLKSATLMSPQVSLGWVNSHYDSPIQFNISGQDVVFRPQETSAGFLQVVQPLSPIIGLIQKLRADHKSQKAAEAGYELTQVEIAFGSAIAYRQIQQLGQLNQISKDRVELSIRQEHDAAAIFRTGRINKSDLLRIQMALGGSKVAAANLQSQYESTLLAFKDLLGIELTAQIELSALQTSPVFIQADKTDPSLRLDIKAAQLIYEAAKENTWLSVASFLPNLSAFARVDNNFINPGAFMHTEFYSLGLNLTWNIWDGGARFLDIQGASLMRSKAHLNLIETTRKAAIDLEQRKLDLEAAKESLELQKTTQAQAEESYKSAFERFKYGAVSVTDLLQSELDLNNAKVSWAKAITDLDIKNMLLQKANGQKRPESLL